MLKSSKGITLVALVITIVLLLILAGVTIKVALDTELFGHAQEAATEYQKKADEESEDIQKSLEEIKRLIDGLKNPSEG